MLQQSQLKGPKKKSYPLVGEPEMADELNKIERSRPTGYREPMPAKAPIKNQKSSFNRDYPLSPTFKSEMAAPTKKQTNKLPKGIVKGIVREGISEAVSTFKKKK